MAVTLFLEAKVRGRFLYVPLNFWNISVGQRATFRNIGTKNTTSKLVVILSKFVKDF